MQATKVHDGDTVVEYTRPETAVDPGDVVVVGTIAGVDVTGGDADELGALDISGVFDVLKTDASVFAVGATVYWDATGNPFVGTAGTGAATDADADETSVVLGTAVAAAGAEESLVRVKLAQYVAPTS